MSEIAPEAGISKSLLFHYFRNKKELYLFLWENCAKITIKYLTEYGAYIMILRQIKPLLSLIPSVLFRGLTLK